MEIVIFVKKSEVSPARNSTQEKTRFGKQKVFMTVLSKKKKKCSSRS